jgi:hypothetical protein
MNRYRIRKLKRGSSKALSRTTKNRRKHTYVEEFEYRETEIEHIEIETIIKKKSTSKLLRK